MADTSATVGGGGKKRKGPNWRSVLLFAAVIILAGGTGAGLRWLQTRNAQDNATDSFPTLSEDASKLQDLRSEGNEEEFNKRASEALANDSLDNETRYQVLLQQGHSYRDKEEYQQAIDTYLQAEQVTQTFEIAELLADTYHLAGDKAKAIEYYRKAIELIPPDTPIAQSTKEIFQDIIKELEAEQ